MGRASAASASKTGKKTTIAKVLNKKRNKEKRSKFREEKAAARNAAAKQTTQSTALSAEYGYKVRLDSSSQRLKKAMARQDKKKTLAKRDARNVERNAPVRPENASAVLLKQSKARGDAPAAPEAPTGPKNKAARKAARTATVKPVLAAPAGEGSKKASALEEMQALVRRHSEMESKARSREMADDDSDDGDDDDDDDGDDDDDHDDAESGSESDDGTSGAAASARLRALRGPSAADLAAFEEEDALEQANEKARLRAAREAQGKKGKIITARMAAMLKAQGRDAFAEAEAREQTRAKAKADKQAKIEERKKELELRKKTKKAAMAPSDDDDDDDEEEEKGTSKTKKRAMVDDDDDEEEEDENAALQRYASFFSKMGDLTEAPLIENVKRERSTQRAAMLAAAAEGDESEGDDDDEEQDDEASLAFGPDSDDDEGGVFDDLSGDDDAAAERAAAAARAAAVATTARYGGSALPRRAARDEDSFIDDIEGEHNRRRHENAAAPASEMERSLLVRRADGSWVPKLQMANPRVAAAALAAVPEEIQKPDLSAYKRHSLEERNRMRDEARRANQLAALKKRLEDGEDIGGSGDEDNVARARILDELAEVEESARPDKGRSKALAAAESLMSHRPGRKAAPQAMAEGEAQPTEDLSDEDAAGSDDDEDNDEADAADAAYNRALAASQAPAVARAAARDAAKRMRVARLARLQQVQLVLAELCDEALANPEKHLPSGHAAALLGLCGDHDRAAQQLAIVSLTQVMCDVIPGYRIRLPTKAEIANEARHGNRISRDVKKQREFEKSIVETYGKLVSLLRRHTRKAFTAAGKRDAEEGNVERGLPMTAIRCLCSLFERGYAFNYSKEIAGFLAAVLTSSVDAFREVVASSIVYVFKADVAGDATLEIVRAISNVFKTRGADRVRAPLLSVLLSLPLDKRVIMSKPLTKAQKRDKRASENADGKRAPVGVGVHNWAKKQEQMQSAKSMAKKMIKKGKEVDWNSVKASVGLREQDEGPAKVDEKALARDAAEGDAEISMEHRRKTQTAILSFVMTIYFRYLKQAPTLKTLFAKSDAPQTAAEKAAAAAEKARKEARAAAKAAGVADPKSAADAAMASQGPATYVDKEGVTRMVAWKAPLPTEPPSHLLLAAVLKGVCQFAPLMDIELVLDLLQHLKLVVGASALAATFSPSSGGAAESEGAATLVAVVAQSRKAQRRARKAAKEAASKEIREIKLLGEKAELDDSDSDDEEEDDESRGYALPLKSALLCIHTTFTLLKMHSSTLTIDLHEFYTHFYESLWQLVFPFEAPQVPLALDCWELMVTEVRSLPPARVAALCRRFLLVGSQLNPSVSSAIVHAVGVALARHPAAGAILHNEGHHSGAYDPLAADPDLSHALGTPAWDLVLWAGESFHPLLPRFLAHAVACPGLIHTRARKLGISALSDGNPESMADPANAPGGPKRGHASLKLADDAIPAFATSGLTVTVGGERCLMSRLAPRHVLRLLDRSGGMLFPDIPAPTAAMRAIMEPNTVPPTTLKQAYARSGNARRSALAVPFKPSSVAAVALAAAVDVAEEAVGTRTFPPSFSVSKLFADPFSAAALAAAKGKKKRSAPSAGGPGKKARHAPGEPEPTYDADSVETWIKTPIRYGGPAGIALRRHRKNQREGLAFAVTAARLYRARKALLHSRAAATGGAAAESGDDEENSDEDEDFEEDFDEEDDDEDDDEDSSE